MVAKKTALSKVAISSVKLDLYNINYNYIDDTQGEFKLKIGQKLSLFEVTDDYFKILVNRNIKLEPEKLFTLDVALLVTCTIDKKATSKVFLSNEEKKKQHINEKLGVFYDQTNADVYLSLIVSQITSLFGKNPLILPGKLMQPSEQEQ